MTLPDFLIIGAMKAGTTTLYRDLIVNPDVYLPAIKEPSNLLRDDVLTPEGERKYADLFRLAKPGQRCGEGSTGYTKLPTHRGVPERAVKLLGRDLKVIYLVREPVSRVISHHYHSYTSGVFGPNIDEEIMRQPVLLDYTRYATQIEPWIEALGRSNVLILVFEEYVSSRRETVRRVSEFLGIEPREHLVDEEAIYNKSDGKPTRSPFWRKIRTSRAYCRYVQPYLPMTFRDRVRAKLVPPAPSRPDPPSEETVAYIHEQFAEEAERLQILLGREEPIWLRERQRERSA